MSGAIRRAAQPVYHNITNTFGSIHHSAATSLTLSVVTCRPLPMASAAVASSSSSWHIPSLTLASSLSQSSRAMSSSCSNGMMTSTPLNNMSAATAHIRTPSRMVYTSSSSLSSSLPRRTPFYLPVTASSLPHRSVALPYHPHLRYMSTSKDGNDDKKDQKEKKASPVVKRKGLFDYIADELKYLDEHRRSRLPKVTIAPKAARPKGADAVGDAVKPTQKTNEKGWNFTAGADKQVAEQKKMNKDMEEAKIEEDEPVVASDGKFYAPAVIEVNQTMWEKRFESMQIKLRNSVIADAARGVRRTFQQSDAPVIKQARELTEKVQDQVSDVRESFDTSQHPMVHRLRDIGDKVTGETEMGYCMGELMKNDPTWDRFVFIEQLEEDLIPLVITAFLKPDVSILKKITEEEAARFVWNTIVAREKSKEVWSHHITDIRDVDLMDAKWINDQPHLVISFVCQQIYHTTKLGGEHIAGSPSELRDFQYEWIMRRDFESPDFDWKLVGFSSRMIKLGLAA